MILSEKGVRGKLKGGFIKNVEGMGIEFLIVVSFAFLFMCSMG